MKFFYQLIIVFLCSFFPIHTVCADNFYIKTVVGRVFVKKSNQEPFSVCPGNISVASETSILTFLDGQCYIVPTEKNEFRMKEEAILAINASNSFEIRKGMVGCSSQQQKVDITTPHLQIILHDGIIVVKSNSVLTRVALIKGKAEVRHLRSAPDDLPAGKEIAAGLGSISEKYAISDDLRFAWYWVNPAKEPSLQP